MTLVITHHTVIIIDGSPLTESLKKEMKLLERTIRIMNIIEEEAPIGIKKLSKKLEIPEHKVRYSLRMLQKEKLIRPTAKGADITEKHEEFKAHIRELLEMLSKRADRLRESVSD